MIVYSHSSACEYVAGCVGHTATAVEERYISVMTVMTLTVVESSTVHFVSCSTAVDCCWVSSVFLTPSVSPKACASVPHLESMYSALSARLSMPRNWLRDQASPTKDQDAPTGCTIGAATVRCAAGSDVETPFRLSTTRRPQASAGRTTRQRSSTYLRLDSSSYLSCSLSFIRMPRISMFYERQLNIVPPLKSDSPNAVSSSPDHISTASIVAETSGTGGCVALQVHPGSLPLMTSL
jgi:hypothetical protein